MSDSDHGASSARVYHPPAKEVIHPQSEEGLSGLDKLKHAADSHIPAQPHGPARTSHGVVDQGRRAVTLEVTHIADERSSTFGRVLEAGGRYDDYRDLGKVLIREVTGARAFRHFSILSNAPRLNVRGQFTGEVVSAKLMAAFRYTIEKGDYGALENAPARYLSYAEQVGAFVGFGAEIVKEWPRLRQICASRDPTSVKGMQTVAVAGAAAQRALLGVVSTGVHLFYRSLEGWCQIVGLGGGNLQSASSKCMSTLQSADVLVQTSFKTILDTESQSKVFWLVVDTAVAPRSRLVPILHEAKTSLGAAVRGLREPLSSRGLHCESGHTLGLSRAFRSPASGNTV